jgi:hypothetical protein
VKLLARSLALASIWLNDRPVVSVLNVPEFLIIVLPFDEESRARHEFAASRVEIGRGIVAGWQTLQFRARSKCVPQR